MASRLGERSRGAGRRVPRALVVSLASAAAGLLLAAPWLLLAYLLHRSLGGSPDARRHDLAIVLALAPLAPTALYLHAAHDLARAHVLERGLRAALRVGFRTALRPALQLRALACGLLGHGLFVLAQLLAGPLSAHWLSVPIAVALLQGALLARLFLRSVWLGTALACVAAQPGPGARAVDDEGRE